MYLSAVANRNLENGAVVFVIYFNAFSLQLSKQLGSPLSGCLNEQVY